MLIIILYLICIMCFMEDFSLLPGGCDNGGKRYDKSVITKQTWFWDLIYNEIKYDNGGHFYIFITLLFEQHKLETNTHKSVWSVQPVQILLIRPRSLSGRKL